MTPKLITDDLNKLLTVLPLAVQKALAVNNCQDELLEVVLDLGRLPEARFSSKAITLGNEYLSRNDLQATIKQLGEFGTDNRAGIERTLHRISAIRNRKEEVIGLTCRVGRAVFGTVALVRDLVESNQSLLLMGRPGVGKTTVLREIARVLADEVQKRVVVIDTSNEIAGDGDIPHPAIGRARRMQVTKPEKQHQVMIEAVENHMPEVIVIDEIGTTLEAQAARTIAERGVQLIATAHGNSIENLIKNPTLSDLIGGIQSVTLGDEEARRRHTQKTVLERAADPTFPIAVEINSRDCWSIHKDVATTVDLLLRGQSPKPQKRALGNDGEVHVLSVDEGSINHKRPAPKLIASHQINNHYLVETNSVSKDNHQTHANSAIENMEKPVFINSLNILCCGISTQIVEEVIRHHNWPVHQVEAIDQSDVLITIRHGLSEHPAIRREARKHRIPILVIKSNTLHQVERAIKRLLSRHDKSSNNQNSSAKLCSDQDDAVSALEECRLALEKVVVPLGKPVDLLPRNTAVLQMQSDLVHRYRLRCDVFGQSNDQRLRVYPP